jgi:hypothetical protein
MPEHDTSAKERQALDNLMGMALLDEDVRQRLLHERADAWLAAFPLSEETRSWLLTIPASTLEELAQAILSYLSSAHTRLPS